MSSPDGGRPEQDERDERDEQDERRAWLEQVLAELHDRYAGLTDGVLADYIPELTRVDPDHFAI
ncbi:MAG: hypothetical protein AAFO29_16870, partial [Actinomycetota bacterium]